MSRESKTTTDMYIPVVTKVPNITMKQTVPESTAMRSHGMKYSSVGLNRVKNVF